MGVIEWDKEAWWYLIGRILLAVTKSIPLPGMDKSERICGKRCWNSPFEQTLTFQSFITELFESTKYWVESL